MFDKILIANRGEIACRVIKTARRMGIRTVAVYSSADATALHVQMADEAVFLGDAPPRDSYLAVEKVVAACARTGAQAVHPGYGFLSENAAFAEALAAAGVVFIGPPVAAIEAMGSKAESKRLMAQAGVPLVPGYHGHDQSDGRLTAEAEAIGYPLLVKASAGGGGKGMRVVSALAELPAALAGARREALAAFGDDSLLLEKYLDHPRHVEMQVFGDQHGNYVHLFERDCSLQRRHQKVIEEAPAPDLPPAIRQALGEAAVAAARAVGYVGAGTVEFLYQDEAFYFIEMNTRLQVEHPVTEMISGQDLVEWQLRVAAGQPLPCRQDQLQPRGHAFEARLYAEDPHKDFLPATGTLQRLRPPVETATVRVDSGVVEGDTVSVHYDPMLAKLIVWGEDRATALRSLRRALADYQIVGVASNLAFLQAVAAHPAFAVSAVSTKFLDQNRAALVPPAPPVPAELLVCAALEVFYRHRQAMAAQAAASADPWSPWASGDGWRMNDDNHFDLTLLDGDQRQTLVLHFRAADQYQVDVAGQTWPVVVRQAGQGEVVAEINGLRHHLSVIFEGSELVLVAQGLHHRIVVDILGDHDGDDSAATGLVVAPMPGKVTQVMVQAGQQVDKGQPLVILEAMKMEHTMLAPFKGMVTEVFYTASEQVTEGAQLLIVELLE
ncbi:acetyl/propionyl/methylcrotonyl-CoA carboxylase subunit alpha [Insolitispirillum peregrinum]|uniref:acetyl/propionyl/methylcrotonyl-CoA carboxylase subunit alpha n=1 Tax=Insolitispirillum peregrinum TaxID=80876 RepID=UPI00360D521B